MPLMASSFDGWLSAEHILKHPESHTGQDFLAAQYAFEDYENNLKSKKRLAGDKKTSKYKGVYYCATGKKWVAQVWLSGGTKKHIGRFASEREAAVNYDIAAKELGAPLNFE